VTLDAGGNLYGTTSLGGASDLGTVFEIAKGSNAITTLASFTGTNGEVPTARVTLDFAGNLYGTTAAGGASNHGTIFEITKESTAVTTLASFNGADHFGGVTADAAGNLYGTTSAGGTSNWGTVFELAKGSTTIATLASFNGTDGADPETGVVLDSADNLYGTTTYGGFGYTPGVLSGYGTVFEIVNGSTDIVTVASFFGPPNMYPSGVTLDSAGNLYGTTREGGVNGNFGTVFEIPKGSNTLISLLSFDGTNGGEPQGGVRVDSSGNLYGTAFTVAYPIVFKLTPPLPGDANGNGTVDFADLLILARDYGMKNATWSDGDFNGDGTVGFDDLVILARNYGKTTTAAATNAAAATRATVLAPAIAPRPDDQSPRAARAGRHRR